MAAINICKVCLSSEPDAVVLCDGVCEQYFHPSCVSRASRSTASPASTCLECASIKPCHVLRLVKNIFGDFSTEYSALAVKLTSIANNWASVQLISEDVFRNSQKIANLIEVTETVSSNTDCLLERSQDIRSKIMLLTDSIEDLGSSLESVSAPQTSASASSRSSALLTLDDIRSDMRLLKKDLSSWFSESTNKVSQLGTASSVLTKSRAKSTSTHPCPEPPTEASTQIPESFTSAASSIGPNTPAPRRLTTSVSVQTSTTDFELPTTPPPLVHKLGTVWTQKDWNRRIQKLHGVNGAPSVNSTPLLLRGAPPHANAAWIRDFFLKMFSITPTNCEEFHPRKSRNPQFLVWVNSSYAWLFNDSARGFSHRGISIYIWRTGTNMANTSSYPKKSNPNRRNASRVSSFKSNTNPKSSTSLTSKMPTRDKISHNNVPRDPPSRPSAPSVSSNWQLKPSLFPNFNYSTAANYPNFIKSHTINPPVLPQPAVTTSSASTLKPRSAIKISSIPPDTSKSPGSLAPPSSLTTNGPSPNSEISQPVPISRPVKPSFIDPLLPPIVKLTKQSADSCDNRYLLSRFRDRRIYDNVRLLLAYLHNKPDSVCIDGKTKTNVLISIHQEGLPTDLSVLRNLFFKFHESLDISSKKVSEDLSSYASYVSSRRVSYLQKSRNDFKNYYRS